ncbi:MAG: hypothetical protein PHT12_04260 [Patescibacteria group bacterium]|nr:hypothetical protein [Patescibacteria group bacterium]
MSQGIEKVVSKLENKGLLAMASIVGGCPDIETAKKTMYRLMIRALLIVPSACEEQRTAARGREIANLISGLLELASTDDDVIKTGTRVARMNALREMARAVFNSKEGKNILRGCVSWLPEEAEMLIVKQVVSDLNAAFDVEEFMEIWKVVCFLLWSYALCHGPAKALETALKDTLTSKDRNESNHWEGRGRPCMLDLAAVGWATVNFTDEPLLPDSSEGRAFCHPNRAALQSLGKLVLNAMAIHLAESGESLRHVFSSTQQLCVVIKTPCAPDRYVPTR